MTSQAFYHPISGSVRLWVRIEDQFVGASIGKETLHYRYRATSSDDDPLETYLAHADEVNAAVRRRVSGGSREPVMVRYHDLS